MVKRFPRARQSIEDLRREVERANAGSDEYLGAIDAALSCSLNQEQSEDLLQACIQTRARYTFTRSSVAILAQVILAKLPYSFAHLCRSHLHSLLARELCHATG